MGALREEGAMRGTCGPLRLSLALVSAIVLTGCASDALGKAAAPATSAPAAPSASAASPTPLEPMLGSTARKPRSAPPGLRGEQPATSGVRSEGWQSIIDAPAVTGQSAGAGGTDGGPRWINPRRAQL